MDFSFKHTFKDGILHVDFKTQYELTSTFMRPQEFYESPYPNIRGKNFSLEEMMDTYAKNRGDFSYTSDWVGFNIPFEVYWEWLATTGKLLDKEANFLKAITNLRQKNGRALLVFDDNHSNVKYIIGSYGGNKRTLVHEYAHAYFHVNQKYRKEVTRIVKSFSVRERSKMYKELKAIGYTSKVFIDEINAFIVDGSYESHFEIRLDRNKVKKLRELFKAIHNEKN